jgi:intracellular sulfur oxidation DsrE/DsrF family protein
MVFQVNEDDSRKWNTVLANINNVQEELGKVEVSVVVIGAGAGHAQGRRADRQRGAGRDVAGVRFVACGNSMQAMKLTKDDMIDGIAHARPAMSKSCACNSSAMPISGPYGRATRWSTGRASTPSCSTWTARCST